MSLLVTKPDSWEQEYPSSIGKVTILTPPVFDVVLPLSAMQRIEKEFKHLVDGETPEMQMVLTEAKITKKGLKIHVFMLGYHPITSKETWDLAVEKIRTYLESVLPGIPIYANPWFLERKFQMRVTVLVKHERPVKSIFVVA